jgi:hypothetical protein
MLLNEGSGLVLIRWFYVKFLLSEGPLCLYAEIVVCVVSVVVMIS